MAPLGIRRGEPGSQAQHSEVRQFYGAVNASKTLPERAKLPPAPKAPEAPSGMAADAADVISTALGFETPHQRAMKAHAAAMQRWRETCRELWQQDAKAWESMKASAAVAPLRQRRHKSAPVASIASLPKAAPNGAARLRPN